MKVETCCDFVRIGAGNWDAEGGLVHLRCTKYIAGKRKPGGPTRGRLASREAGDLLCSKNKGQTSDRFKEATRDDFLIEPCHKCVAAADTFGIDVGSTFEVIPGPRMKLYTTSSESRDRPYAKRGKKPVGYYNSREVYCVEVPEDLLEITRQWYQRDLWHCWTPEMWQVLLEYGRAVEKM